MYPKWFCKNHNFFFTDPVFGIFYMNDFVLRSNKILLYIVLGKIQPILFKLFTMHIFARGWFQNIENS